jgi:hypothetical protein
MKQTIIGLLFTISSSVTWAQQLIKENDAGKYVGKSVEVLGHAYLVRVVNKGYAIVNIGYNLRSANLQVYFKFKNAAIFANMTNHQFGHFIGNITLVNGSPILIVDNLHNARYYVPNDERVDSAVYYHKKNIL